MLTGRGPMKCTEMKSHALSQADPSELMTAVANTLTDLCDRMDRLERFVQTMETRIRGSLSPQAEETFRTKATKLIPTEPALEERNRDQSKKTLPKTTISPQQFEQRKSPQAYTNEEKRNSSVQRIRDAISSRTSQLDK